MPSDLLGEGMRGDESSVLPLSVAVRGLGDTLWPRHRARRDAWHFLWEPQDPFWHLRLPQVTREPTSGGRPCCLVPERLDENSAWPACDGCRRDGAHPDWQRRVSPAMKPGHVESSSTPGHRHSAGALSPSPAVALHSLLYEGAVGLLSGTPGPED